MDKLRRWRRHLERDAQAIETAYRALEVGSDDPEALHTLRVALRNLRARLAPFADQLADHSGIVRIRVELGALAHETNTLRDEEVMRALLTTLPGSGALLATLAPTDQRLDAVLAAHRAAIDALPRRVLMAVGGLDASAIETTSRKATRRARRKLQQRLGALTPASPAHEWHAARLLVKKARYLHDGQALWLGARWRDFGAQCKPAQEALGHLHDLDVLHGRLGDQFDPALILAWQNARCRSLVDADASVWLLRRQLQP